MANPIRVTKAAPVKGKATRSYESAPRGGTAQKARGVNATTKFGYSSIPNK